MCKFTPGRREELNEDQSTRNAKCKVVLVKSVL
jgi:hypothetical protein